MLSNEQHTDKRETILLMKAVLPKHEFVENDLSALYKLPVGTTTSDKKEHCSRMFPQARERPALFAAISSQL
jgi:hypothetical protein